ncbi:helix-turn-helix domain-containing protein [Halomonas sp. McH1-25]|uniref:helix-turn-helix domain-containing protein n=1 Tax=unclassified Halomonas TaxID=2609666 RepID=UPI001EF57A82|nr:MULTISPECIES: helix-turn-helix domain-containing protein [unclassified Halomonas]MCG7600828.1 helix-turn-helix domain-containing protein [Halomonas sp. McH1-25]MCP1344394.1 helix-turn-helix domain-containing protein [Halomonas sp. FL8]MCP1362430.1 helix-turn-helix domain-containing protein [Halomonas sp. BBD45]MCP1367256.1 helix-turn-helix domain-containing protein [Halomonas sp. BBD48]
MAQDRVESVERALTVLDVFDSPQDRFTLAELANATGYYKSTLLRLLSSLERFDYVQRGQDGRFRLGHAPVRLARRHLPSRQLEVWIQPVLESLTLASGETAALIEVTGKYAECRLASVPDSSLRHELRPGERWRIEHAGSPARDFPGGIMVCRQITYPEETSLRWLALSGPSSRLTTALADKHLDAAQAELERRPTER